MPIYSIDGATPELPQDGSYWIAPTAVLIGRVRLKKNASVCSAPCCAATMNGSRSARTRTCRTILSATPDPGQPVTIGANVTVGHNVILHSTTVGDNSLIGMGSILLNRSKIGANCLVGANTLIAEGKEFADGSMILGSPGRVLRPLGERELAILKMSSQTYVHNYKRFGTG